MMIQAKNLLKKYSSQNAVNGLSLTVKKGEFYSLLGPNGAGKTTTIQLLSSLLKPDEGEIIIDGKRIGTENEEIKLVLGIVPQEISLYDELSAHENLIFWGKMYRVENSVLEKRINLLLSDFGLFERRNDKIKTFSGGMKRRINIAASLLHEPKIVFMDEPTVGIDPQSRNNIYDALAQLKNKGTTILYTTHYMEEAERFSDRVGIIDAGKIIAEGTVEELKKMSGTSEEIQIKVQSLSEQQILSLQQKFGDQFLFTEGLMSIHHTEVKKELIPVLNFCASLSLEIESVEIQKTNLEKVFLSLTGKNLRD
jgi:ABC-2 type transport system ATP-binding protein